MENRIYTVHGSYNVNVYYDADIEVNTNELLKSYMVDHDIEDEEDVDLDNFDSYIEDKLEDIIAMRVSIDGIATFYDVDDSEEDGIRIDSIEECSEYDDGGSNCDQYVVTWEEVM